MPHRNIRILFVALVVSYACYVRADHSRYARHAARALTEIEHRALYRVPGRRLLDGAVAGMVNILRAAGDEHSSYIRPKAAAELVDEMQQSFGGVGIVISLRGDPPALTIVAQPEPGMPAAGHDIRPGDVIVAIDGTPTEGLSMGDVLQRMRGPVGAPVLLTLRHARESDTFQVRIRRAAIPLDSIKGHFKDRSAKWRFRLPENERLAHVRITAFADRTLVELVTVLTELQQLGVKGVVLDLRDNAGGDLETAVAVSDLFLAAGQTIVTIKDRFENVRQQYVASEDGPFDTLPLAVLIDRNSASASEILAACLQDNGRAVVIGDRSFGKGTVQHLIDIGPPIALRGSEQPPVLKLTSASYWRPSGKNIHRKGGTYKRDDEADWGVHPTAGFEVSLSDDEYKRYKLDRLTRDAYNPNGNALPPVEGESEEPFLDRALGMAVADLEEKSNK